MYSSSARPHGFCDRIGIKDRPPPPIALKVGVCLFFQGAIRAKRRDASQSFDQRSSQLREIHHLPEQFASDYILLNFVPDWFFAAGNGREIGDSSNAVVLLSHKIRPHSSKR